MAFPQPRDHRIALDTAAALTRRYRETAGPATQRAQMFPSDVFEGILKQPGCQGIRVYYGRSENGTMELVLVGVDSDGNDMTAGVIDDRGFPCPPVCTGTGPLGA
jgi:hypothetical protein